MASATPDLWLPSTKFILLGDRYTLGWFKIFSENGLWILLECILLVNVTRLDVFCTYYE